MELGKTGVDEIKFSTIRQLLVYVAFSLFPFMVKASTHPDSLRRWGVEISAMPGKVLAIDKYEKKWLHHTSNFSLAAELCRISLPADSNAFASDYDFPSLSIGLRYTFNCPVRMHRYSDPDWGMAEEVNYDSRLGNTLSLYLKFQRALARTRHWETSYSLSAGLGYSRKIYDKNNNIDDELIGTHALIYFGADLRQTYHIDSLWGITAGVGFVHHSNGALYRPNKGSNTVGITMGIAYTPYYYEILRSRHFKTRFRDKCFFANFSAGLGGKALLEDWLKTQFHTSPDNPDYRTSDFHVYVAYSFSGDLMYRYARRWASGIGADMFYGSYASHVRRMDKEDGYSERHSPWSLGLAAKHNVYYGNLSLRMSLGYYLFREMGHNARQNETRYYERIGLHYSFPRLGGLTAGINVKAHKTKADFTELALSIPVILKKADSNR